MIDKLHYISQSGGQDSHLGNIKKVLQTGCKWIQLRVKNEPENVVLRYAIAANELCKTYDARLIINDYPEIALKAGAYGLHLGLQDVPVKQARLLVGSGLIIGGTANTFEDILQRAAEGVDYIGLGPYRFTPTKKNLSPIVGLAGYRSIMEKVRQANIKLPIIAIGGIELEDIPSIKQTGIFGVAVSGALTYAGDPAALVKNIYRQLNAGFLKEVI